MGNPPAFQLYASDFLIDTAEMSTLEVGAYTRLLFYQWVNESLPKDPKKLCGLAGVGLTRFNKIWDTIGHKFQPNDEGNRLVNKRLEKTRIEQEAYRKRRSDAGKKGAIAKQCSSNASAERKQSQSPSPSTSSSKEIGASPNPKEGEENPKKGNWYDDAEPFNNTGM